MREKRRADAMLQQCYAEYRLKLFNYCLSRLDGMREAADDCVQEAFVVFYNKLLSGEEFENPRAFLYRTADNFVKRQKAAAELRREIPLDCARDFASNDIELNERLNSIDYDECAKRLIKELTDEEKQLYDFRYQQKLGVEEIYNWVFYLADVEELTIPSSVKTIYCGALSTMKIGTLNFNAANAAIENVGQNESLLTWCTKIDTVNFGESVRHIGSYFAACSDIKSLNLTDNIESIGEGAFEDCRKLTNINLPKNLKSIGDSTFASCINLKSVDLPEGLEAIGKYAFDSCGSLESIEFPDSVEIIGNYAFTDCTALTQITLPKNAKSIGTYAFKNCTGLTEITIPENVQSLSQAAFEGCTGVKEINLYAISCSIIPTEEPDADNIPVSPFSTLESLEDVHIYGTVKELPPYLFSKMQNIDTIELPASVTDIGTGAFANSSITSVNALGNIESIEEYAFKNCVNLTEAPLEDGIMLIGMEAFSGCKSLRSVYIPDSIFNIEIMAFAECENLESVRMSPNVDYIPRKAFYNCVSLSSFELFFLSFPCFFPPAHRGQLNGIIMKATA